MNKIKKTVLIVLCLILAIQILAIAGYAIFDANNRGAFAEKTEYYRANIDRSDYEKILLEFSIPMGAADIDNAKIIASSNGETVLLVETVADISSMSDQMQNALRDEYGDTVSSKMVIDVFAKVFKYGKAQQLWRLANENVKVTAYQGYTRDGQKQDQYALSVRLPIDKFEFAKQNGKKVEGFPKGKCYNRGVSTDQQ
ncbi:MAG: hypothetical protein IKK58_02965 [Clostridia bacterium]|nr:hypothetical protein [Clostridia bacterium]